MKKSMALLHIKLFSCHITLLLKRKLQHVGHRWVICGSHSDCSVGQWVKWINRCDPLLTLQWVPLACLVVFAILIATTHVNQALLVQNRKKSILDNG